MPDQSTTNIPTRIRSYEDLSTSVTNTLHRSISDSTLNHLLNTNNDPSALTTSIRLNPPNGSTQTQQIQFNRLQTSPSANSLFGSPNHLALVNEHSTPNPLLTPSTPDNRLKQQIYPIDDSSPDIIQLATSVQRFQLNIHSVDNILRIQTQPRRHTNSTSSTTSSLSEAWSLPRINSYEQNATNQRVVRISNRKSCHFFLLKLLVF